MEKRTRLLEKIRNNSKNVDCNDLKKLIELYGFVLKNVTGDHFHYKREGFRTLTIPRKNPVWIEVVKQVLRTIDEIEEIEN